MQRRNFLKLVTVGTAGGWAAWVGAGEASARVPMRALTKGPKFHWFGYYDKLEFDPTGRWVLANQVTFEGRSPRADDVIKVGMVDTADGDKWIELGESRAWNWQQGCMLQWIPKSQEEVIWNDREGGRFVSHICNVRTGAKRTLPNPIYCLSHDGTWGLTLDFRRLNDVRPGYGYAGLVDPKRDVPAPDDAGIWKVDLATGKKKLLFSFATVSQIPHPGGYSDRAKHWFNHLLIAPDDKRFIFLHRWRGDKEGRGFATRMFTADNTGKNLYLLDPHGKTSHFIWRDSQHVLAWAWHPTAGEKFYLYTDLNDKVEVVGGETMTVNGHCSYLPGGRWILNDSYPNKERWQQLYLYHVASGRRVELGQFPAPPEYDGEWRCDLHPRFSPDGKKVAIDSAHVNGRQVYLLDIGAVVG